MLIILHINTTSSGGGAAAVMQHLCRMIQQCGYTATILTGRPQKHEASNLHSSSWGVLQSWCAWRGQLDYHILKSHKLHKHPAFQKADILHLHNLHGGYFNLWSLPALSAHKPTVWILHDMQALTGHCAYSLDCERWLPETGCSSCQRQDLYPRLYRDTSLQLWQDKRTIYAHSTLYLITPSVWLQRLTEKSIFKDHPLVCIPNGVDTSIFKPTPKYTARQQLNIPRDALVVGGCANGGLGNPWKGGEYTIASLLALKKEFPQLRYLNIGAKQSPPELKGQDWVTHIPYVHKPTDLARLYAALDLLLYPTLADNHPLVCIESLCCGTPIAGFATGGVPEIVRHGEDGILVPTHDGNALTQAATLLLKDNTLRQRMGQNAALSAAQRFNLQIFAQRYERVYEDVLRQPRSLQKSRLPLTSVPCIVKSCAFMRLERTKYLQASMRELLPLVWHCLAGSVYRLLASLAGWPLQLIRFFRAAYFRKFAQK